MKIKLFPFLGFEECKASVNGDVITINGSTIDLSPLKEGYRILGSQVGNKFFVPTEYVQRIDGELSLTLFFHVEPETDEKIRNPETPNILDVVKGNVPFPNIAPIQIDDPELNLPEMPEKSEPPIIEIKEGGENDQLG